MNHDLIRDVSEDGYASAVESLNHQLANAIGNIQLSNTMLRAQLQGNSSYESALYYVDVVDNNCRQVVDLLEQIRGISRQHFRKS